jgi:hypothetical protein
MARGRRRVPGGAGPVEPNLGPGRYVTEPARETTRSPERGDSRPRSRKRPGPMPFPLITDDLRKGRP